MKILIATDGSDYSKAAVNSVAERPWPKGSEVKIISAMEVPFAPATEGWVMPDSYYSELDRVARVQAEVGDGLMRFSGVDHYANGSGRVRFWLLGIIPLVQEEGPNVSRAALGRMVCETIWLPSSLLPQRGVQWEASDDKSARATMKIGDETVALNLFIEPDGRLREIKILRWGDQTEDGSFGYVPFGGQIQEERDFGGYTIPSKVGVGWRLGTDSYFEFFRARIETAVFR
jgi:Family of unknown function (DUF6920)